MIDIARHITLRIATPEASGSAFYLPEYDLIATALHVIRGYRKIVIEGDEVMRQLAEVVFTDETLDLALLKPKSRLSSYDIDYQYKIEEEAIVIAYAYPFRESEKIEKGFVDIESFDFHGIPHIMHDALLGNASNGSPLFSETGKLLGLNSFMPWKGRQVGITIPIRTILDSVVAYNKSDLRYATICPSCNTINDGSKSIKCTNCNEYLEKNDKTLSHKITGIGKTIETLLESMGYTLELSRIGADHWEVERGSAAVNITYFEKNGLIIGDAYMCKLPPQSNLELYEFLLRQNHEMENLTFSVKGDDIILSLLIYDRYLNEHTGTELLTNLLERADRFDNILVEQYQCLWTSSRKLT